MIRRPVPGPLMALAAIGVVVITVSMGVVFGGWLRPSASGADPMAGSTRGPTGVPSPPTAVPAPHPYPKHEVYGFLPYWEMTDGIPAHLAATSLTTLALFSVTNRSDGTIDATQNGYKSIVGSVGTQVIREAHDRKVHVQLVFTSFGAGRNATLFGGTIAAQDRVIASLVAFAHAIDVDGIDVDVEQLATVDIDAYGAFVGRLRESLRAETGSGQVSVATAAGPTGAAMALAAAAAGADRIFLMGYDYRVAASAPGATAPIARDDGGERSLVWSLDLYASLGVPVDRTLLGLPLYGMAWPVDSGEPDALPTGRGAAWAPSDHLDVLADGIHPPALDPIEQVEVYRIPTTDSAGETTWQAIFVDSAATLTPKLALADDRGLAGAGFWALGYERGVPDITALIARFATGRLR